MLDVVCFKWKAPLGYRSSFSAESVNALRRMVDRHYADDHRVTCITDDPSGIDSDVRTIPLWSDFAGVPSPHGIDNPSCYRRLKLFAPEAAQLIGPRFVCIDLDVVIVDDVRPLWNRPEPFVALRDPFYPNQLNGSLWLLRAGARPDMWTAFDPVRSPAMARSAGFRGSDQAWMSYRAPGAPTWGKEDGVYSYRADIQKDGGKLPADARLVSFHGMHKPWDRPACDLPWVRQHYQSN